MFKYLFLRINLFYLLTVLLEIVRSGIISVYLQCNHWGENKNIKFPNKYAPIKDTVKVEKEKSPKYTFDNKKVSDKIEVYLLPQNDKNSGSNYKIKNFVSYSFSY